MFLPYALIIKSDKLVTGKGSASEFNISTQLDAAVSMTLKPKILGRPDLQEMAPTDLCPFWNCAVTTRTKGRGLAVCSSYSGASFGFSMETTTLQANLLIVSYESSRSLTTLCFSIAHTFGRSYYITTLQQTDYQ